MIQKCNKSLKTVGRLLRYKRSKSLRDVMLLDSMAYRVRFLPYTLLPRTHKRTIRMQWHNALMEFVNVTTKKKKPFSFFFFVRERMIRNWGLCNVISMLFETWTLLILIWGLLPLQHSCSCKIPLHIFGQCYYFHLAVLSIDNTKVPLRNLMIMRLYCIYIIYHWLQHLRTTNS